MCDFQDWGPSEWITALITRSSCTDRRAGNARCGKSFFSWSLVPFCVCFSGVARCGLLIPRLDSPSLSISFGIDHFDLGRELMRIQGECFNHFLKLSTKQSFKSIRESFESPSRICRESLKNFFKASRNSGKILSNIYYQRIYLRPEIIPQKSLKNPGKISEKSWKNPGKILEKSWKNPGKILEECF